MTAVFTALVAAALMAGGFDAINTEIRFVGWDKYSNEFGYLVDKEYVKDGKVTERKTIYFFKELVAKGKLRTVDVDPKNVTKHIKNKGYVKYTLTKESTDELTWIFKLDKKSSSYLKFEVMVGKELTYRFSNFSGVKSRVIKQGTLDDVYTTVEPALYLSPSGTYAVCVVKASTPYSRKDFMFFFRVN